MLLVFGMTLAGLATLSFVCGFMLGHASATRKATKDLMGLGARLDTLEAKLKREVGSLDRSVSGWGGHAGGP